MSGPRIRVDYVSDTNQTYSLSMPAWAATLIGESAGASSTQPPRGLRPRVRYVKITSTGRERKIIVPDVTSTFWTQAFGVSAPLVQLNNATPLAATVQGRTGERTKNI